FRHGHDDHPDLHSFPTRRSSDLSGNHDNLTYEDDWGERYHGLLEDKGDGKTNYSGQDNAPLAKNLKGKLFLLHGMMDDNVPPQSDRKSTRLNSSHVKISYAVFCL